MKIKGGCYGSARLSGKATGCCKGILCDGGSVIFKGKYLVNNDAIKSSSEQDYGKLFAGVVNALLKHQG
ncbi:hypothetical protein [Escherichia coli]|uniref:hypothetical protein n=1 Tax=Escherichia coli TaxID=562 RepID=UPI00178C2183|nr:hypothetical protein [Escherichia coli]